MGKNNKKKDWKQLLGYAKDGYLEKQKISSFRAWSWLATTKIFFFFYLIGIPAIVTSYSVGFLILAFVIMQYVSGMILSTIFQPAHVSPGLRQDRGTGVAQRGRQPGIRGGSFPGARVSG